MDDNESYQKPFNLKHLFSAIFEADGYRRFCQKPLGINLGFGWENSERTNCDFNKLQIVFIVMGKCIYSIECHKH